VTRRFLLVGLTGGLATGKSTVSDMLRGLGCVVLDADVLAREVVEPGQPALATIAQEFGPEVLRPDGTLDRKRLGAIVFADPERRRRLEAITHPAIRDRYLARLAELEAQGFEGVVVWDAPVMIESGGYKSVDRLVVVITDAATQRERALARDGDRADVERKIASQMPLADKAALADYVIDNSGDRAAAAARTREVHSALGAEGDVSRQLLRGAAGRRVAPLGVTLPVNMGNRGRNELPPRSVFARLHGRPGDIAFLGYHWRRSGNFVFVDEGSDAAARAGEALARIIGLRCIGRGFPALTRVDWRVPSDVATTKGGSVVMTDPSGVWRVIAVFLSAAIPPSAQFTGMVTGRIRLLCWPSERDVLCAYDRPGEAGDVGQVTRAVVARLASTHATQLLVGSGRAVGVIRDILRGRGLRST